MRHQRTGGHHLVAFRGEKVEESLADFGAFHGGKCWLEQETAILREQNEEKPARRRA
jgi:hypothetical protein